jgi:2-polyprenyl-3-methyl-5-hydroxy-6-metoxy-1,4-benzoquinol methylase
MERNYIINSGESQYYELFEEAKASGLINLGVSASLTWKEDPKRLAFILSRYKFVAKMLKDIDSVAEIGCGDGFASRIVAREVHHFLGIDFDPRFIADAKTTLQDSGQNISFVEHDILAAPIEQSSFDAIFSCDVLEHIPYSNEKYFFINSIKSLKENGIFIVGTPSLASQEFASPRSKEGHVNCKSGQELVSTCRQYFNNVFLFSMNDEVLHTGHTEMSHYYFALCLNPK